MRNPDFYNTEGYPDPTHYFALQNIKKEERQHMNKLHCYRPIVYICSPFKGDISTNIKNARRYSRFAVLKGFLPITPHLLFPQFLNDADADERERGIYMGLVLMTKCVELWVFGDTVSEGMAREIKKAKVRGIIVRHFSKELQEETRC